MPTAAAAPAVVPKVPVPAALVPTPDSAHHLVVRVAASAGRGLGHAAGQRIGAVPSVAGRVPGLLPSKPGGRVVALPVPPQVGFDLVKLRPA